MGAFKPSTKDFGKFAGKILDIGKDTSELEQSEQHQAAALLQARYRGTKARGAHAARGRRTPRLHA